MILSTYHYCGCTVFITAGLGGDKYGTFRRLPNGSLRRVKSSAMPMVIDPIEAQMNLDTWAEKKGLKKVGSLLA